MKVRADLHYTLHNETSRDVNMRCSLMFSDDLFDVEGHFKELIEKLERNRKSLSDLGEREIEHGLNAFDRVRAHWLVFSKKRLEKKKRELIGMLLDAACFHDKEVEEYRGPDTDVINKYQAHQIRLLLPRIECIEVYEIN